MSTLSLVGKRVLVTGLGVSGFAAADVLAERGAIVLAIDSGTSDELTEKARILEILGAHTLLGEQAATAPFEVDGQRPDLVVTSPGWRPDHPLFVAAHEAGVPVWGDVELAWQLRPENAPPWLCVTGTNGKTTTVRMVDTMLRAAGHRPLTVGNVGASILETLTQPEPFDVVVAELSSFQLHYADSVQPLASVCLNLAPDHVDWHGSEDAYRDAKAKVYQGTQLACVYNVADPATEQMVREADVQDGCRAIGFTLNSPAPSMLGVVEDILADRAFVQNRQSHAAEMGTLADVKQAMGVLAPHHIANVLAAAALVRAFGVPTGAIRDGLRQFRPEPHRMTVIPTNDGLTWIDDSKATNAHAAHSSLSASDPIVWIAGGLAKGATFDDLIVLHRERLRAVVLIGVERSIFKDALARHAPSVPVIEVTHPHTGTQDTTPDPAGELMDEVVRAATGVARPGDTVLLAPACASMDQFRSYIHRGEAFKAAVQRMG